MNKKITFAVKYTLRGVDRVYTSRKLLTADADTYKSIVQLTKTAFKSSPGADNHEWYLQVGGLHIRGSDLSTIEYFHIRTIFDWISWKLFKK